MEFPTIPTSPSGFGEFGAERSWATRTAGTSRARTSSSGSSTSRRTSTSRPEARDRGAVRASAREPDHRADARVPRLLRRAVEAHREPGVPGGHPEVRLPVLTLLAGNPRDPTSSQPPHRRSTRRAGSTRWRNVRYELGGSPMASIVRWAGMPVCDHLVARRWMRRSRWERRGATGAPGPGRKNCRLPTSTSAR
jgi:hypothetical protein